jgi:hypothetical protein
MARPRLAPPLSRVQPGSVKAINMWGRCSKSTPGPVYVTVTSAHRSYRYGGLHGLRRAGQTTGGPGLGPRKDIAPPREGRRVVYGDADDSELWETLNLGPLAIVIQTTGEEEPLRQAGADLITHPLGEPGSGLAERSFRSVTFLTFPNSSTISHVSMIGIASPWTSSPITGASRRPFV